MSTETPETPQSFSDVLRQRLADQRPAEYGWVFEGSKRPEDNAEAEAPNSNGELTK